MTHKETHIPRIEIILLLLMTALGAGLRFYQLDAIPPGFHHDEAFEAVEALKILAGGYHPIFFTGNFGVEPLFIYLTAVAFKLFGVSPTVMRGVAALIGSLTIPALYWLGKELERAARRPMRGMGIGAAAMLAGLYWHINFSRVGIEPILVPLDATLIAGFLWRGVRTRRWIDFALSGLFLGLSPYTYPAGRLLPFLVLAFVLYAWLVDRARWKPLWRRLLLLGVVAFIVFLPLGITFAQHPELLTLRTQQVATFAEGGEGTQAGNGTLQNVIDTIRGISIAGDENPRSNLPGRPLLDPFLSALFYVGLLAAIWRWRDSVAGFILLWLGMMLVPTILSEYAPHFRRAIGAAPAVALLIGYGVSLIWRAVERWRASHPGRIAQWTPALAGVLLCAGYCGSTAMTASDYFVKWANNPELFYAFDVGLAEIAQEIADEPADQRVYLSPRSAEHPTIAFSLWDKSQPETFDGRYCIVLPPTGAPATYWIIDHEDWRGEQLLIRHLPDATLAERIVDGAGKGYAVAYRQPADGAIQFEPAVGESARFGEWGVLQGWTVINPDVRPGEVLYLDLFWEALAPASASYTLFVHLLGGYNPATNGPVWAGADSLPGGGSFETTDWQAGERIVDEMQVSLPADLPAGEYEIEIGWYDLRTMQRVPALDRGGQVTGDHLILGTITIQESP